MAVMDPFAGAAAENQDQKRALLDVIAQSGSSGEKAFQAAQAQIANTKQEALARADQRAQLTGQNLGGLDTARVGETADRFTNYGANANQQFQQNLQGIGASGQSYLDKIGAIAPFVQSRNVNAAADRENQYKMAIAQAQEKAAADAQAKQDQRDFELLKLGISNQNSRDLASMKEQAAATKAAAPTTDALLGQAAPLSQQSKDAVAALPKFDTTNITSRGGSLGKAIGGGTPGSNLNQQAANILSQGATGVPGSVYNVSQMSVQDLAAQIGRATGASDNVINSLYSPSKVAAVATAIKKNAPIPAPDQASILATKVQGVDSKVAGDIAKDPEYQETVGAASDYLNIAVGADGKIVDDPTYNGWKPFDAYMDYMNRNLAPQKTRTRAVIAAEMLPIFRSLGRT